MKVVAIIQARMGSTRFPGKVIHILHGTPVLGHVIERLRQVRGLDEVIVAIHENDRLPLADAACAYGANGCYGCGCDESDVLQRFVEASAVAQADWVIRVCADNPLINPAGIETLIEAIDEYSGCDYIGFALHDGKPAISEPTGYFAEAVSMLALRRLHEELPENHQDREHVTKGIYESRRFSSVLLECPAWYKQNTPMASIDTPDDLVRVSQMMEAENGIVTAN